MVLFQLVVKPSDDLILDDTKHDEFHIFTRPGFHTGLAFTSGMQYKGSIWDKEEEQHMVVSDRKNSEWCHVVFTLDHITKRLRMYTNGQEVNNSPKDYFSSQRQVNVVPYYIGCANPNARYGDNGFFKGHMVK